MEDEKWVSIVKPIDLSGRYEISNMGRLKRCGRFKINKVWKPELILKISDKSKYLKFAFRHNKKIYNISIHRLVCWAFYQNTENKPQVNHINAIKHDNRAVNLEWCSQSENIRHAQSLGIMKTAKPQIKIYKKREDKKRKPPIVVININTGEKYLSVYDLCEKKGLSEKNIRRQISGQLYCHVPYRYLGRENDVKLVPPIKVKVQPKKKIRIKKVYIPHPLPKNKMIMYNTEGIELSVFDSSFDAACFVKSNPNTFRRAIKRSPKSFTKGYVFKYV